MIVSDPGATDGWVAVRIPVQDSSSRGKEAGSVAWGFSTDRLQPPASSREHLKQFFFWVGGWSHTLYCLPHAVQLITMSLAEAAAYHVVMEEVTMDSLKAEKCTVVRGHTQVHVVGNHCSLCSQWIWYETYWSVYIPVLLLHNNQVFPLWCNS